jgi:HPt (histidine-containing phosphotransfer) domain-containing protein
LPENRCENPILFVNETMETEPEILDRAALAGIHALQQPGSPSLLAKIIDIYLEHSPKLMDAMRRGVARPEAAELVRDSAHSLKSSSANLGASGLAALCGELERISREERLGDAGAIFGEIEALYPLVREQLIEAREIATNGAWS